MSRDRTITVRLTEAQYGALASAVAREEQERIEEGLPIASLNNGWRRLSDAWHGASPPPPPFGEGKCSRCSSVRPLRRDGSMVVHGPKGSMCRQIKTMPVPS